MSITKKSTITIEVHLDENNNPADIQWKADDHPTAKDFQASKAMFLSLFDKETKDTLKIDLWTKDFQVMEMDRMMFQTFKALTETYQRSTKNKELAGQMQQFVQYFGEKTGIIPTDKKS